MIETTFVGEELRLRFTGFDLDSYPTFLKTKSVPETRVDYDRASVSYTISMPARYASLMGITEPPSLFDDLPISDHLFDDQRVVTTTALKAKRYAVWSDCGLGKTMIELEFARHVLHRTRGRVLLVSLNDVVDQIIEEAARFYPEIPILRLESQAEMIAWAKDGAPGLAITNYEKFNPKNIDGGVIHELRHLSGVVLDESSRLKNLDSGRQAKVLNQSCKGVEYKLSCTATPAPNEMMEFITQALFLEYISNESETIYTFFGRDDGGNAARTVKPHARAAFFEFLSQWSIYLKSPKRFGWRLDMPDVPKPTYFSYELVATPEQMRLAKLVVSMNNSLFLTRPSNAMERMKLAQLARGFIYGRRHGKKTVERVSSVKPEFIADLAASEVQAGHQVLVWTVFDEEVEILRELLSDRIDSTEILTGKTPEVERSNILRRFRQGKGRVLVSRPAMLGYGLNFQCCTSMIFSGFTDSFESLYQAIRRAVRYGQTESVRVHFPVVTDLEDETFANLDRKALEHERASTEMEDNYLRSFRKHNLFGVSR